jgi:hypothetical protein
MRRLALLVAGALLLAAPLAAQVIPAPVGGTLQKAAGANGNGTTLPQLGGYTVITYQVSGTFSATINPEVSLDNANWTALSCVPVGGGAAVTTFTGTGSWRCNLGGGYQVVRARISGWASGTVTVEAAASYGGTSRLNDSTFPSLTVNGDATVTGTVTAGQVIDSGLSASAYVKTDSNKQLTSQAIPIPCADGGTGLTTGTSGGVLAFTAGCTLASSSALVQQAMVIGGGTGTVPRSATQALTNGQVYVGRTGADPVAASIQGTSPIVVTGADGSIMISTSTGIPSASTQAQMETATDTTTYASPGRTQNHPGVAKGWGRFGVDGTIAVSYNVASIVDGGTGLVTVNWSTPFSSANYTAICGDWNTQASPSRNSSLDNTTPPTTGAIVCHCVDGGGSLVDPGAGWMVTAFGDQ